MSTEPKKISIDSASIIDLKAELLKKQQEYKLKRLERTQQTEYEISSTSSSSTTKNKTWGKKKIIERKIVEAKSKDDDDEKKNAEESEISVEEENLLKKSKLMLESKAKYYEDLVKGSARAEQGDEEIFLVDFDRKAYDRRREERVDDEDDERSDSKYAAIGFSYDKKLNLKASTNEEDYKEQLREKWEEGERINAEKGDIHYADILYNEARERGVGSFQFSTREEERKKQMAYFDQLKSEAAKTRQSVQQEKKTRQEQLKERLRKVKQKRLLKEGYSLEDIESMFQAEDEAEMEATARQEKEREEEAAQDREETEKAEERKQSLEVLKREWDKPKLKEPMWNRIVENMRQERYSEFAPTYQNQNKKSNKKKQKKASDNKYNMVPPPMNNTTASTQFNIPLPQRPATAAPMQFNIPPPPIPFMYPPPANFTIPPPPFIPLQTQPTPTSDIPMPPKTE